MVGCCLCCFIARAVIVVVVVVVAGQSVRRFIRTNRHCTLYKYLYWYIEYVSSLCVKKAENLIFVEIELGLKAILNNHLKYNKKLQEFCYDYHMSQL